MHKTLREIRDLLKRLVRLEGGCMEGETPPSEFPLDLSRNVPANTSTRDPVTSSVRAPYEGRITTVILGFPAGSNQAAGLNVSTGTGELWIPRAVGSGSEFVGLDDKTIEIELNVEVEQGEQIVANFANNDSSDHFLDVIVFLKEVNDNAT